MSDRLRAATSAAILLVGFGTPLTAAEVSERASADDLMAQGTPVVVRNARQAHVPDHCFAPSPLGLRETEELVLRTALVEGVDPDLAVAVARRESRMGRLRVSPAGAMGTMQLMPGTARGLGVDDACDPIQNVPGGVRYLKAQLDRFDDPALALAAYNAGPTRVAATDSVPPFPETKAYVAAVLGNADGVSLSEARARIRDLAASRTRGPTARLLTASASDPTAAHHPSPATDDDPWIDGIVQHF